MTRKSEARLAFQVLFQSLGELQRQFHAVGANAFMAGDYTRVEEARACAEEIGELIHHVEAVRDRVLALETVLSQSKPEASDGTPEKVRPKRQRPRAHERLQQSDFRLPILAALVEFGGRAKMQTVIDRVEQHLQHRFSALDIERLDSNGEPRWRNHLRWERKNMVDEGLLMRGSPHGVWEITPAGGSYLAKARLRYSGSDPLSHDPRG